MIRVKLNLQIMLSLFISFSLLPVMIYAEADSLNISSTNVIPTLCLNADLVGGFTADKVYLPGWSASKILKLPKGKRPLPATYLKPWYMAVHLLKFSQGGSWLVSESSLKKYGRKVIGRADGQFIMPHYEMDAVLKKAHNNIMFVEKELGIPNNAWHDKKIIRIDVPKPQDFNLRIPDGNEIGANIDWLPAGKLPRGYDEAIVDQIPKGHFTEIPLNLH